MELNTYCVFVNQVVNVLRSKTKLIIDEISRQIRLCVCVCL